jgi:hypothetical protein
MRTLVATIIGYWLFVMSPVLAQATTAPGAPGPAPATGGWTDWWWIILLVIIIAAAIWYFTSRRPRV